MPGHLKRSVKKNAAEYATFITALKTILSVPRSEIAPKMDARRRMRVRTAECHPQHSVEVKGAEYKSFITALKKIVSVPLPEIELKLDAKKADAAKKRFALDRRNVK